MEENLKLFATRLKNLRIEKGYTFDSDDPVECRQDLNEVLEEVIASDGPAVLQFKKIGITS